MQGRGSLPSQDNQQQPQNTSTSNSSELHQPYMLAVLRGDQRIDLAKASTCCVRLLSCEVEQQLPLVSAAGLSSTAAGLAREEQSWEALIQLLAAAAISALSSGRRLPSVVLQPRSRGVVTSQPPHLHTKQPLPSFFSPHSSRQPLLQHSHFRLLKLSHIATATRPHHTHSRLPKLSCAAAAAATQPSTAGSVGVGQ